VVYENTTDSLLQPLWPIFFPMKTKQRIVSVKRASEAPPIIAVLIQDDLVPLVNNYRSANIN